MPAVSTSTPFGQFRRGSRIASGGMGEVYVAARLGPGGFEKPVALKLLLPDLLEDDASVRMFLEEGRLAARMSHPNVVQIYEIGQERGRYYLAMELVQGSSLSALISSVRQAGERFTASELNHIARCLCEGLHHAHEQLDSRGERLELVHRDVSPHNVLISRSGEVKVTDFGIAKARDTGSRTRDGNVRGKLQYLAPEQLQGGPIDRRVDIHALGVTLYQAATLASPFERNNEGAVVAAILHDSPRPLRTLRPDLSPRFCDAVDKALSKAPESRFQTLLELRRALPEPGEEGQATLGARVVAHCGPMLERLELAKTGLSELKGQTASMSNDPVEPTRRRGVWPVFMLGGALALGAGLWLWGSQGSPTDESLPPPSAASEPAAVPPTPVGESQAAPAPAETPVEVPSPVRATTRRAPGFLSIDAQPWAVVYVDGRKVGETPMARFPVEKESVTVTLKNPETGKSKTQRVRVVSGKRHSVKADLR
jgi:eukaryotic-like serine/threonine-protein kinase